VNQDFLDLLSAFNAGEVLYLVVGAYAVGVHGHPRATKDLDVWIEASPENAARVVNALRVFFAASARVDGRAERVSAGRWGARSAVELASALHRLGDHLGDVEDLHLVAGVSILSGASLGVARLPERSVMANDVSRRD